MPKSKSKVMRGEAPKKKRVKQKQKQKTSVKTNVKVNVQSSGGSGGGGSSQGGYTPEVTRPAPYIPSAFQEARLANILDQIAKNVPVNISELVTTGRPIPEKAPPSGYNPRNDSEVLNSVFSPPLSFDAPYEIGGVSNANSRGAERALPNYEEVRRKFEIDPIDLTGLSQAEQSDILGGEFHPNQEFIIQPKKGGRKKGSKNKPKKVSSAETQSESGSM